MEHPVSIISPRLLLYYPRRFFQQTISSSSAHALVVPLALAGGIVLFVLLAGLCWLLVYQHQSKTRSEKLSLGESLLNLASARFAEIAELRRSHSSHSSGACTRMADLVYSTTYHHRRLHHHRIEEQLLPKQLRSPKLGSCEKWAHARGGRNGDEGDQMRGEGNGERFGETNLGI